MLVLQYKGRKCCGNLLQNSLLLRQDKNRGRFLSGRLGGVVYESKAHSILGIGWAVELADIPSKRLHYE